MDVNPREVAVTNNEAASRFETHVAGHTALLFYRRFLDRIVLVHTEVPPALEGHGIAAKLVQTAIEFARSNRLRVVPVCPYVATYLRKHPEDQDLLSGDDVQKVSTAKPNVPSADRSRAARLMAFYVIARRAQITNHPDLIASAAFREAQELYEARASYLQEGFGNPEAVNDYFKFHLEGALTSQGKRWEDAWAEFAPQSLRKFPLSAAAAL